MIGRPVVAATDGSEGSLRAVEWAAREAVLHGAPLRIMSATSLPKMAMLPLQPEHDAVPGYVRDYRDRALATAAARAAAVAPACRSAPNRSRASWQAVTGSGSAR